MFDAKYVLNACVAVAEDLTKENFPLDTKVVSQIIKERFEKVKEDKGGFYYVSCAHTIMRMIPQILSIDSFNTKEGLENFIKFLKALIEVTDAKDPNKKVDIQEHFTKADERFMVMDVLEHMSMIMNISHDFFTEIYKECPEEQEEVKPE